MEQQDIKNKIWSNLDRLRTDQNFSGFRDTKLLELIGTTFGAEKLDGIFQDKELITLLTNSCSITAPNYVFKFIEELIKTDNNKSVLDPWLTLSSPLLYIQADNLNGTCMNQSEFEAIKTLFKDKTKNFKLGDTLNQLSQTNDKFDLILSFLPFGMRTQSINSTKSSFDFATTLLLKPPSATLLRWKKFYMKHYVFLSLFFLQSICFGQIKSAPKTDFNTFFICIDSTSYKQLYQSKYLKDTLFFCKEMQQETNTDSYIGKYLIGESSTIEFFQPQKANQIGDHFGDWGIEFKTRKINTLDEIIKKSKYLKFTIDTSTTKTILDSLPITWYKTLSFKNSKNELTVLEYQADYLQNLGFTTKQIAKSMTLKEYNSILSNGKKYPRQFEMVTYIKLYADKKVIENLQKFAKLNNCIKIGKKFTNGEITIEYEEVENLPEFPIQEIGISLLNDQKFRIEKISENLYVKINGKKANLIFKNKN